MISVHLAGVVGVIDMSRKNNNDKSGALAALAGAAMALPAISQLAEAAMPTETELGYQYSRYTEDDLSDDTVVSGDTERYDVDIHQFRLVTPLDEDSALTVDAVYESLSGASPLSTIESGGESRLIMSGASISESRTDVAVALENFAENSSQVYRLGYSTEEDYDALHAGYEHVFLRDRITSWNIGGGIEYDEIDPVDDVGVNRVSGEDKWFANAFASVSRVLNKRWQVQVGLSVGLHDGYLSDPYRSADIRPDQRQLFIVMGRSRYFLPDINAALHGDYRFYADDWGIESHTLDLAWHQSLGDRLQLIPRVRYYSQSQADFYFATDQGGRSGYQSSDAQLSPYGALSYGLDVHYRADGYTLKAYVENYESKGSLALGNVDRENPALVSYTLVGFGVDYRYK